MASWTEQSTNSLLPGQPWTSAKALAAFENPRALAEGASGAPTMQVAWHLLQTIALGSSADNVTFTVDISQYRAIRVVGAATTAVANNLQINVQVQIASTWRTAVQGATGQDTSIIDVTVDRIDAADFKVATGIVADSASLTTYAQREGTIYMRVVDNAGAASAVRVATTGGILMTTATEFHLYGIKRTAA